MKRSDRAVDGVVQSRIIQSNLKRSELDQPEQKQTKMSQSVSVRNAALNLLARREHTCLELRQKLARKFPQETQIDEEIQKLVDQNLLNEQRFIESFIRMRHRQGKGPRFIAQELIQRGLNEKIFEADLSDVQIDWTLCAEQAYLKKYGEEPVKSLEEKMKRQRFLMTKGFSSNHIRHVARKYFGQ